MNAYLVSFHSGSAAAVPQAPTIKPEPRKVLHVPDSLDYAVVNLKGYGYTLAEIAKFVRRAYMGESQ